VRTLVGVLVVGLILAGLASAVVHGVRRVAWPGGVGELGRTTAQRLVEGLILLAAVIAGVVVVVAFLE
jgi:hypothetical protein